MSLFLRFSSMDSCVIVICIPTSVLIWRLSARIFFLYVNVFILRVWRRTPCHYLAITGRISICGMNSDISTKHPNAKRWLRCSRVSCPSFVVTLIDCFFFRSSRAVSVANDRAWLLHASGSTHGTDCFSNAQWWSVVLENCVSSISDYFVDHHFKKPELIMLNLQQGIW